MKKLLVFTDLDGSLLDHDNYSWEKARPALTALAENNFPVIFTSSKTADEIIELKQQTGNEHPFICENGAVARIPVYYFENNDNSYQQFESFVFGRSYRQIISLLNELRETYKYDFYGFNDMDVDELVDETSLTREQAKQAMHREASEPLLWRDTSKAFSKFKQKLEQQGLFVTSGGRFTHVMNDVNKGKTVEWLIQKYREAEPGTEWLTVGIGDSFNDVQMLEVVMYPVLISNSKTRQPDLSRVSNLQRPQLPGPAGWNQAILSLMKKVL